MTVHRPKTRVINQTNRGRPAAHTQQEVEPVKEGHPRDRVQSLQDSRTWVPSRDAVLRSHGKPTSRLLARLTAWLRPHRPASLAGRRRAAPRIAFVGFFEHNGGSANTLYGYFRAAQRLGYDIRASSLGIVDPVVQAMIPVAETEWEPDLMVLVFESHQFLHPDAVARIEKLIPRSRRVVVDQDGMYSPETRVGADTNHPTADSQASWTSLFDRLSDTILQPCLNPVTPGVRSFLYFGFERQSSPATETASRRAYDIVYVGNNWYRWHDLVWLCRGLASVRARLGRIAVFGKWWLDDAIPLYEEQTYSDPAFLRDHGVEMYPAVRFDEVERTMKQGRLNPVFVRPVLNELGFITPRMFETFAADTIPLLPPYLRIAVSLYGSEAQRLCLPDEPAGAVLSILDRYADYVGLAQEIGAKLAKEHSYEVRLAQLLGFCR